MKKRVLLSASLFHALNDAATVVVPMIFPLLYSQKFIIEKYSHIGILSNLGLLTTFLFQILIIYAAVKHEYRLLLLAGYLGISLSLILLTSAQSYFPFLSLYILLRVFTGIYHPVGITWVSRTHPSQGIDFAMGIQSGSGNVGVVAAFITTGLLAQKFGWKTPLFVWAAIAFILGTVSFLAVRKTSSRGEDLEGTGLSSWLETLGMIRTHIPGFVFGGICWGTTVYFAPSLFHHRFDAPLGETGFFLAAWIGIGTVSTYLFGTLSRRFGRRNVFLAGFAGATLSLFLLGSASSLGPALLGIFLFGAFLFLLFPALQSNVGNEVPPARQTLAFSLVANIQMLSGAAAVLAAGFISDTFGISVPFLLLGILGAGISFFYSIRKGRR